MKKDTSEMMRQKVDFRMQRELFLICIFSLIINKMLISETESENCQLILLMPTNKTFFHTYLYIYSQNGFKLTI